MRLLEAALWRALRDGGSEPVSPLLRGLEAAYEAIRRLDKCVLLLEAQLKAVRGYRMFAVYDMSDVYICIVIIVVSMTCAIRGPATVEGWQLPVVS